MADTPVPRFVRSVMVEETADDVIVTWTLGDPVPAESVEYFGYGVDYYGADGNGGKRLGVQFHSKTSAFVLDWSSATQANYEAESVTLADGLMIVHYRDADIGVSDVGLIQAFSHVNGDDMQTKLPVTLFR